MSHRPDWDKIRRQRNVWKNGSNSISSFIPVRKHHRHRSSKRNHHKPPAPVAILITLIATHGGSDYRATYQKFGPKWKLISCDKFLDFLRSCGKKYDARRALFKRRIEWRWFSKPN